ncbi:P-loop containing nucleoside triphosphate hydrolase protein [Cadophora sp. MPI-SDFR-AT-0126]|nr:P-loop containing nucleoside triphosphate hydrolase protein [Leotiomycetes sp. MPI-SDFR-AT-0126]
MKSSTISSQDELAAVPEQKKMIDSEGVPSSETASTISIQTLHADDTMEASYNKDLDTQNGKQQRDVDMPDTQNPIEVQQQLEAIGCHGPEKNDKLGNTVTLPMDITDTGLRLDQEGIAIKEENTADDAFKSDGVPCRFSGPVYRKIKKEEESCEFSSPIGLSAVDGCVPSVGGYTCEGLPSSQHIEGTGPYIRHVGGMVLKEEDECPEYASSHKRKQPGDDPDESFNEEFWQSYSQQYGFQDQISRHSTTVYEQTCQPAAKRLAIGGQEQSSYISNCLAAKASSRVSSVRNLSHMLNQNQFGNSESQSRFLKMMKGFNPGHVQSRETSKDKAPALKSLTKAKLLQEIIRSCPKTSDSKQNKSDLEALKAAVNVFGRKMKAKDGKWLLNNMNSALLNHQAIGLAWMYHREKSDDPSKGGMLCDSMGLGKTVQMIATMVANPPNKSERKKDQRGTLIIAGPTLLAQWKSELRKHAAEGLFKNVTIFQAKKREDLRFIAHCDVVFASYGEVTNSCPFPSEAKLARFKTNDGSRNEARVADVEDCLLTEQWISQHPERYGDLHRIDWYRIVIDESHRFKSHDSKLSHAVNALNGKHRWTLSGTPIMNNPEELYAYFRFFREPDAQSFSIRSMEEEFMGRPIIDLPTPHYYDEELVFSPQEEIIYRAVEAKYIKAINELLDEEGKDKTEDDDGVNIESESDENTSEDDMSSSENDDDDGSSDKHDDEADKLGTMLVGLSRLRQMTAHPLLIENEIKEMFDLQELVAIHKQLVDLKEPQDLICRRFGILLKPKKGEASTHDKSNSDNHVCLLCGDFAEDPHYISGCKHKFCRICIESNANYMVASGEDGPRCPECERAYEITSLKRVTSGKKSLYKSRRSKKESSKKPAQYGEDSLGIFPPLVHMPWLREFDAGRSKMPPSTKLKALENQIRTWMIEAPEDKQIIFTQWRGFAGVVGRVLKEKNIKFVYFTGDMSPILREKATEEFASNPSIQIMVATLKTAGEGLNLEFANRVVSIDPWWNVYSERQAFCRVYRIGQTKETYFTRLNISDSVDQRILELQAEKIAMIGDMMKPKVTKQEMAKLFGRVRTDKNGRIRIESTCKKKAKKDETDDSDSDSSADDPDEQIGDSESEDDSDADVSD